MPIELSNAEIARLPLLTEGGEALIYRYGSDKLIKKYKPHINVSAKEQKINAILRAQFPSFAVGPIDTVVAPRTRKFQGAFVMMFIENGEPLHQYMKMTFRKMISFSNKDALELSGKILTSLAEIHDRKALIGDISDFNIHVKKKSPYFLDVDSWGVPPYRPDAYTETFTAPEFYKTVNATLKTEYYSTAVLIFNLLTGMHPFSGIYPKERNMVTKDRMISGISVLGNHKIKVHSNITPFRWMSPDLLSLFHDIFEKGVREDITPLVQDMISNMAYCKTHGIYYYSKYTTCPICDARAKIKIVQPTHVSKNIAILHGDVLFSSDDVRVIISSRQYMATNDDIVHIATGKRVKYMRGKCIEISDDGNYFYLIDNEKIEVFTTNYEYIGEVKRMYATLYEVIGNTFYFVNNNGAIASLNIDSSHNLCVNEISYVCNPLFSIHSDSDMFVVSPFMGNLNIDLWYAENGEKKKKTYKIPFNTKNKIKEYAIKFDEISKTWLFIYQLPTGQFRTLVFSREKIEYDSRKLTYDVRPLLCIGFFNKTIYEPGDGTIRGFNVDTSKLKLFRASEVAIYSKIHFSDGKMIITNYDKVYRLK